MFDGIVAVDGSHTLFSSSDWDDNSSFLRWKPMYFLSSPRWFVWGRGEGNCVRVERSSALGSWRSRSFLFVSLSFFLSCSVQSVRPLHRTCVIFFSLILLFCSLRIVVLELRQIRLVIAKIDFLVGKHGFYEVILRAAIRAYNASASLLSFKRQVNCSSLLLTLVYICLMISIVNS